jgi:hypothetical protein
MQEIVGSNPIGDIAFFGGKTCSTVTDEYYEFLFLVIMT